MDIKPGTKVEIHTKKGDFNCIILESPSPEIILVKLPSGYNIGVNEEDILNLKVVGEKEKKSDEAKIKIGKNKNLPNIALVATGGTISSRLDYKTGGVKWLTNPEELLRFYPGLLEIANISRIEIPFMKASENMDFSDWKKISEVVGKLVEDEKISGVIITHGTDFLHYTASALAFSLRNLNKPVVLTYSQRSSDRASSDASLNLQCAARMAVSGVNEVMLVGHANSSDDFCYALPATKVRKMHSSRRDTFRAINALPIAKVWTDRVEFIGSVLKNSKSCEEKFSVLADFSGKVALIKFYPGQDPSILEHYYEKGYKGVIIESSGLGHLITDGKNNWIPKLKKIIDKGFVVCAVPQTLYGKLHPFVYSAGRELEKTGIIYLKDMLAETAFVKLSWVLGNKKMSASYDKIKENMLKNFAGEINERVSFEEFLN
jgi:glutamyl-tRNA(Gln) amidotransferase subunit D